MSLKRSSSGSLPSRNNQKPAPISQRSKVSDALVVSQVASQTSAKHQRVNSLKSSIHLNGNERPVKSKQSDSSPVYSKKRSQGGKSSSRKPAWLMKQSVDDLTPRTDRTSGTHNVPLRPSVQDFLEVELTDSLDTYENNNSITGKKTKQQKTRNSLLEFLSLDTARSEERESLANHVLQKQPPKIDNNLKETKKSTNINESDNESEFNFHRTFSDEDFVIEKHKPNVNDLLKKHVQTEHKNFDPLNRQKKNKQKTRENVSPEDQERACKAIQIWWRKARIRRTAGKAAMQRMMENKRNEMQLKLNNDRQREYEKQLEDYEQMREKEEKARIVRQQIIADLHIKKKTKQEKFSKTKYLSSNRTTTSTEKKRHTKEKSKKSANKAKESSEKASNRPSTGSSIGRRVDKIFESSCCDSNSSVSEQSVPSNIDTKDTNEGDDERSVLTESVSVKSKTTFADLMNTLKELEDDNEPIPAISNSNNREKKADSTASDGGLHVSSLLSVNKLQSIISFLDEVEKVEDNRSEGMKESKTVPPSQFNFSDVDSTVVNDHKESMLESASQVASDITNAIQQQKEEIDEKQKTVDMMKKAINQQKEFTSIQMRAINKEHKQQLSMQREEYEGTIQRHLSFIDQLIDDKKVLTQRCEELVSKLKDIDQKYSTKIKQMGDSHVVELKKQKEIMEAAEKLRREKWIKEKTQVIKEITVKGLEPDIQKLIGKHKAEIKKIKAMKQGEVLEADERIGRKYIQQLDHLRVQLEQEKEIALRKEREGARQRYENQIRDEEESFQQQRRRLYKEIEEEKERLTEQTQQLKKDFDERKSAYEVSFKQSYSIMEEEYQKQLQDNQQNHQTEVKKLKEQLDIEKQQWIENYMKKQETHLLVKERELKEGVREARDKEIEMVIARLEQESSMSREESERAAENRIKRIRDKYENEIKDLERSERNIQEKCNALKGQVDEMENGCIRLKSDCKAKDQQLLDMQKLTDRLQEERGKVTDIIRQEFADRLVALEEESKRLRTELSEEKARHKFETDRLTKDKEDEMEEVYKRVKKAISKKEEMTQILRQQMLTAEKRAEHLEQLLADQRKKILER